MKEEPSGLFFAARKTNAERSERRISAALFTKSGRGRGIFPRNQSRQRPAAHPGMALTRSWPLRDPDKQQRTLPRDPETRSSDEGSE